MNQKNFFAVRLVIAAIMTLFLLTGPNAIAEQNQINVEQGQGSSPAPYPPDKEIDEKGSQTEPMSMFQLLLKGGVVGGLIVLLSLVGMGLIIDYAVTIRREKLAPPETISTLKELIGERKIEEVREIAIKEPSFLSNVVSAGVNEINLGYQAMIKAMEDSAEALSARMARKIEHLNVIGNIAPMMGLLGTVIGMLRCFNEISQVTGAVDPKQLAGGIFVALVTTCLGLIVAIPTLYFYAIFRNRVDELTGEASMAAEEIVASYKYEGMEQGK